MIIDKNSDTIKLCFTQSKDSKILFATLLEMTKAPTLISSINTVWFDANKIAFISLMGADEKIKWSIDKKGL